MKTLFLSCMFIGISGLTNISYAEEKTTFTPPASEATPIGGFTQTDIDNAKKKGIEQCRSSPSSCGITPESQDMRYNSTARLAPQIIMAGASPSVIDLNDDSLDVIAIVRPGVLEISKVSLSQNGDSTFGLNMTKIAVLSNNDEVWKSEVQFERGAFGRGDVPIVWGDGKGQFSVTVTDGQQRSESFPSLKSGNYPILNR